MEIITAAAKATVNEFIFVKSKGVNNFHSRILKKPGELHLYFESVNTGLVP